MNSFDRFPSGKERKEVISKNRDAISHFKKVGKEKILVGGHYSWVDSSADDSMIDGGMNISFEGVLPKENKSLIAYIEDTLENRKGKAIGAEFGGMGSRLFGGFSAGFFAQSIGVSLVDHRDPSTLGAVDLLNETRNHSILEGDIFSPDTYGALNEVLNGAKVDLIIERMAKGLEFVPQEPYEVSKILQIWYSLLREEGIMFIQVPIIFNNLLKKWAFKISEEFNGLIEIEYKIGKYDRGAHCSSFRLRKLKGAPEKLPLLDPGVVQETRKWSQSHIPKP